MKNQVRIVSPFLALALLLCALLCACGAARESASEPATAEESAAASREQESFSDPGAAPDAEYDEFTLSLDGATYELTKAGALDGGKYVVPAQIDGYAVSAVADALFSYRDDITELVVPEGIRHLGGFLCANCGSLRKVTVSSTVYAINGGDFMSCASLAEVSLAEGLEIIGGAAFASCTSLKSIELPSTLTEIESRAFSGCSSLEEIVFRGTAEQWDAVIKGEEWDEDMPEYAVRCSDGDIGGR